MKYLLIISLAVNFVCFSWLIKVNISLVEMSANITKLRNFAISSSVYYDFIEDDLECLFQKDGMNFNDIHLASKGKTRKDLQGTWLEKYLPVRDVLDSQIPECERVAERRGWTVPYGPWQ